MTSRRPILILKTGTTSAEVRATHGDFDRWFTDALSGQGVAFELVDATMAPLAVPDGCAGIIVTGSPASVRREEPWMAPLEAFLRSVSTQGIPLLGVCFGAQILAHAYGSQVIRNPEGWEIGGIDLSLEKDATGDPLFTGLTGSMKALATHEDRIENLPAGATLLASNASSPIQAFRLPGLVWGVQFHPEITPAILEILIQVRRVALEEDTRSRRLSREEHVAGLLGTLVDPETAQGRIVLENFVGLCLKREGATAPG